MHPKDYFTVAKVTIILVFQQNILSNGHLSCIKILPPWDGMKLIFVVVGFWALASVVLNDWLMAWNHIILEVIWHIHDDAHRYCKQDLDMNF